jgi:Zn finger protein HypA/HybF involved in hydrogenase expression
MDNKVKMVGKCYDCKTQFDRPYENKNGACLCPKCKSKNWKYRLIRP